MNERRTRTRNEKNKSKNKSERARTRTRRTRASTRLDIPEAPEYLSIDFGVVDMM
jgi:hypothetical protein